MAAVARLLAHGREDRLFARPAHCGPALLVAVGRPPRLAVARAPAMSTKTLPGRRDLERALRVAGLSARQAKLLLSRGYGALRGAEEADAADAAADLAQQAARLERLLRST